MQTSLPLASQYQETDYTEDRQAFPSMGLFSEYTRGQTTQEHRNLLLAPISVCQETDYVKTDQSSPGAPPGEPGDRLHKDRQVFPQSSSQSTGRQTTYRKTSLPLGPFSECTGGQTTSQNQKITHKTVCEGISAEHPTLHLECSALPVVEAGTHLSM